MRVAPLLFLALLAACTTVADPESIRAPKTSAEWQSYNVASAQVERVARPLQISNGSLCSPACILHGRLGFANGVGGFNTRTEVYLPIPMVEFTRSDDELALVLAHEWSHVILGHFDNGANPALTYAHEQMADCVGTLLAMRAGYDASLGAGVFRRLGQTSLGVMDVLFSQGDHPGFGERIEAINLTARRVASLGREIPKAAIEQTCGVRFP